MQRYAVLGVVANGANPGHGRLIGQIPTHVQLTHGQDNRQRKEERSRQDIGFTCNNGLLNHLELPQEISAVPWATPPTERSRRQRAERKQKRGKRGGLRAKLRLSPHRSAVPSLFLANVRALAGKMDELRLWTTTQRWIRECNVMIVTEPWLNGDIPDTAVELDGRSMFRADRVAEDFGKSRGGGVCASM
ncbi:hypothetical protein SRHO_G00249600 [Serrasalmus rhombeus]